MTVVTVARQLGSGGDHVAECVAEALGYEHVDRRLVEEIAGIMDTSPDEVEKYDEKKPAVYLCQFSNQRWVVMLGKKIFVKGSGFF